MPKKINVCFMGPQAHAALTSGGNYSAITRFLRENPDDHSWLKKEYSPNDALYVQKKIEIDDFELKVGAKDYDEVDFENCLTLYKAFKDLPRYILCDERFWLWVNFEKGYKAALQAMPIKSESTFRDHWTFYQGKRRGLMFGPLSRCYFRVEFTIDDDPDSPDPYELTRFATENVMAYRESTWRANSNLKPLVRGVLKAEKRYLEEGHKVSGDTYTELPKRLSKYLAVTLADSMTEEDFEKAAYKFLLELEA